MQGIHQRKYGVATVIPFVVYDPDGIDINTTWTPANADLTVNKDGAGEVTVTATAVDVGSSFTIALSIPEMTAARVVVTIIDAATKAILDDVIIIETYGNASAQHAFDRDTASTAQTGDSYPIVNHASYGNAQLVRSTTPANTLDVSAGGEAGMDWANVGGQGTTVNLSATTTNVVNTASALTGKTGFSLVSTGLDLVTAWTTDITGSLSGSVGSVTGNVNGDVGGDVVGSVLTNVDGTVASVTGNVDGSVGSISGITFPTNFADLTISVTTGLVSLLAATQASIDAIEVDTASLNDGTVSQPSQGAPTTTPTLKVMNQYLYFALVNRFDTQTSGTDAAEYYDTAGTSILWKKLLTDDTDDYSAATGITGA